MKIGLVILFKYKYYILDKKNTFFITFSLIKSFRILFIITWNIADEFVILKNIIVGLKNFTCIVNTLFHLSPFLILILLNLYYKFIFVNTFLLSILSIKSVINRSG